jgi:hypothetical protein
MGSSRDRSNPVFGRDATHAETFFKVTGSVIHAWQEMAMGVDHPSVPREVIPPLVEHEP